VKVSDLGVILVSVLADGQEVFIGVKGEMAGVVVGEVVGLGLV